MSAATGKPEPEYASREWMETASFEERWPITKVWAMYAERTKGCDPDAGTLMHLKWSVSQVERLLARVAELETAAVEARAALGALCYDLEDPGSNAFGALHLLSQATVGANVQPDDAAVALAKHDAKVLRQAAEAMEATDRDDDAVNFLYLLADGTEKGAQPAEAGEPR